MELSNIGRITKQCWLDIPKHYPNVSIDEFIIMPNHIHGIVVINKNDGRDEAMPRLYIGQYPRMSQISPTSNSLSTIVGSYKSICTKQIRKLYNKNFQWQSRFYDHIIRNEESLNHTRQYIQENPIKWEFDLNNPGRLQ